MAVQSSKPKVAKTGYFPREWQDLVHQNDARFKVLVLHRRAGKSVYAINEIIDQALRCTKKNPQFCYIGVTFGAVKRIMWDISKLYTQMIPGVETNEADLRIEIPRPAMGDKIKIMLLSAENPSAIRGIYLDGCVLDEYSEMSPEIWTQVIRPALSDRGGWAVFTSTPKGWNHFWEIYKTAKENPKDWFGYMLKASESGILPQEELDAAKNTMSEDDYEQEFECSFGAALKGAYYGKQVAEAEKEKRITKVVYDKAVPVGTAWDLGIGDTTSIWFFQVVGREYHILEHIVMSGVGLEWYVKELRNKPYIYDEHILPHDAEARELGTGKTRVEMLRDFGLGRIRVLPRSDVDDGIHAARMLFNKCWFDAEKCRTGLDALRAYERKWDEKNKIFTAKPLHNWASHPADAFRYFAMGVRSPERRAGINDLQRQAETDYDIFNYSGGG